MADWVPLNDLSRSIDEHRDELSDAFRDVLRSGWLVLGPQVSALEEELAAYLGCAHVVGVASGTDALMLSIQAAMPPGRSAVVTAANAGGYATTAIHRAGYAARLADVEEADHCLSVRTVEPVLTPEVGVVVVTHLYGQAARVEPIRDLCRHREVALIEDCAQALGAHTATGMAGTIGDLGTLSFYPTKNLGALGDGGAVAANSAELADRVRRLRQYGWTTKYRVGVDGGCNSRLDEVQASILRSRLPRLETWNRRRRDILSRYVHAARPPVRVLGGAATEHVAHLAVAVCPQRGRLADHLAAHRIRTDVHYPVPDHHQPAWADRFTGVSLPVTERLAQQVLTLPLFPQMHEDEVERVCQALAEFC